MLDEPLPSEALLRAIVRNTFEEAKLEPPPEADETRAVDARLGLAAFPAEQVVAMSLSKRGLDHDQLWERKRQVIEQAPGLTVWRGGETFQDIGGCANIKRFLQAVLKGAEPPRVIVFCDEIEKAFAETGTDLSGVTTEMTGTILSWMQNRDAEGSVLIGPLGTAKSMVAKATGNTAGIPTIAFDLSAMKNGIIGSSGEIQRRSGASTRKTYNSWNRLLSGSSPGLTPPASTARPDRPTERSCPHRCGPAKRGQTSAAVGRPAGTLAGATVWCVIGNSCQFW